MSESVEEHFIVNLPSIIPRELDEEIFFMSCLSPNYCSELYDFEHCHAFPYSLDRINLSLKLCCHCADRVFANNYDQDAPMAVACVASLKALIQGLKSGEVDVKKMKKKLSDLKVEHEAVPKPANNKTLTNAEIMEQLASVYPLGKTLENFLKRKTCPCSEFELESIINDDRRNSFRRLQKLAKIRSYKWRGPKINWETEINQLKAEFEQYKLVFEYDMPKASSSVLPPDVLSDSSTILTITPSQDALTSDSNCAALTVDSHSPVRPEPNPLFVTIPPGEGDDTKRKLTTKNVNKQPGRRGRGHKRNRKLKQQEKLFF